MSEVDDLVGKAQKQLEEHKTWLMFEINKMPTDVGMEGGKILIVAQVGEIKLRVAKATNRVVTVVYEYPDELYAFLSSDVAPKHLRDTLTGGHVVDPNQPTFTAKREV